MIHIGPAGWSYADWEGRVYPKQRSRGFHPLRFLARYLDCVEVNTSFYRVPEAAMVAGWARAVEEHPRFRFTAKLHQDFTHRSLSPGAGADALQYQHALEPLREHGRLAALLAQFPLRFRRTPENVAHVHRLHELFHVEPLVIEVRHRTWFEPEGLDVFQRLDLPLAHIDLPAAQDHPPAWHPPSGPLGYLRLHGRNSATWFDPSAGRDARYDYLYAGGELDALAQRARRLAGEKDETYVVTNNHFAGKAVANAIELLALLRGGPVPAPADLVRTYPRLAAVALAEGQGELF